MNPALGVREKHQDWEDLLERAFAEECSAPANLLELVRQENRAVVVNKNSSHPGWFSQVSVPRTSYPLSVLIHSFDNSEKMFVMH